MTEALEALGCVVTLTVFTSLETHTHYNDGHARANLPMVAKFYLF